MNPAAFHESLSASEVEDVWSSATRWRRVLLLTVLLMNAVIWGTWFEIRAHEKRQALDAATLRQGNLAIAVGHYLARALGNADAVAQFLVSVHGSPREDFPAHLAARARANDLFTEMRLCRADGTFLTSATLQPPAAAVQTCARWLREAPPDAKSVLGAPLTLPGRTLVPFLTRVPEGAEAPGGVIVLLVDVRRLLGLLQDYSIAEETVVLVAGADGSAKARWHSALHMADQSAPEAALLPGLLDRRASGQVHAIGERRFIVSARRLEDRPVSVLVATSEADTLAEPRRRSFYYAGAAAAATLMMVLFAVVLLRLQARTIRATESLGRARQRLHAMNMELEHQVRERTGELEAAYRDLESFSYTVAHDVRAPIAAIQGFADALAPKLAASADPKVSHYLQRIAANAKQMAEITDALLVLGKLSRSPVRAERVDLSALARDVLEGLQERELQPRPVQLEVQEGLVAQGDPVLVRQVLENLLSNAWKFTARRDPARIAFLGARREPGWMTFEVRDNGQGFDMAHAANLFQPFRRAHDSSEFAGSGVGLAAVERIVRLHGGRTWIDSSTESGTSVFFTLPAAPGEPKP